MSQNNVEIVRQPIAVGARSRRRVEERLGLRFPRALALLTAAVWRLPSRSRLRQFMLRRSVISGWQGINRGDLEVGLAFYDEHVESVFDSGFAALGFENTHGRDVRREALSRVLAEFREFRFESDELIDLGDDRLLVLGRMRGSGLSSAATFDNEWANLVTISKGRVIRDQVFRDRAQALEAVGLTE
jgi:ketosteroid isomerase-like protein